MERLDIGLSMTQACDLYNYICIDILYEIIFFGINTQIIVTNHSKGAGPPLFNSAVYISKYHCVNSLNEDTV